MVVRPGVLFKSCYGNYGIAAVNVWCMEQVLALFSAAEKTQSPFIVQTTPAARNYANPGMLLAMIAEAARIYPGTVYAVHLDHGNESHIYDALSSGGYSSVMIDASHDSFEKNIERTKDVVQKAHEKGIEVEAELGVLGGIEDDIKSGKSKYTKPSEVVEFVAKTGCDSLAIAIGTSHGAYKFSGGEGIQFDILQEIQERIPGFPLVLHGGSEVNTGEIERINRAGGKLKTGAKGVTTNELRRSIKYGICKVNIATDSRLIWTRVNREFYQQSPEMFDPIIPGKTFMNDFEKFIIEKFQILDAANTIQMIKLPV